MRKGLLMLMLGIALSAVSFAQDGLIGYEAPSYVLPGSTVTMDITYASTEDCDVIVYFRDASTPYNTFETQRFQLTAGVATTSVDIEIKADAPVGDTYEYAVFLTETGGEWGTKIGDGINTPASVVDVGLISYEAPSYVLPGSTVTMDITYASTEDCDVIVYFRDASTPYNTFETQRFQLTAGVATTSVDIEIKADAPIGDGYEYAVFLTETGGEWGTKIGDGINTPASVVADPTTPTVELSLSANTGTEVDATEILVTATASEAVSGDQTVNVIVTGVDASDYTLSATTITIADGETVGTVTFKVVDDTDVEDDETATITISSPSAGLVLGTTVSDDVVITSDDTAVGISSELSNQGGRISYPTVSSQFIYFKSEVETVQVVNLSGQVVLNKAGSAIRSIDVSSLQNSVYVIVIDNNKFEKIIKK